MARLTSAVMAAALAACLAGPAYADLKVGIAAEPYPPFASKDASGKWVGWEIDFMKALCAEITEKCEVVETAWDGIIPALASKKFDIILASMAITPKRLQEIAFSRFYYNSSVSMIVAKGAAQAVTPEALAGKSIGAQVSTISAAYGEKHFKANSDLKTYATLDDATADLAAGRIDAVQGETNALEAFLASETGKLCCQSLGRVPADPETLGEGVGAGLRKDDAALKARIDAAIMALATSGKLKDLTSAYPSLVTGIVLPE